MTDTFLIISFISNVILCMLVQMQRYKNRLTIPLFSLAALFPLLSWTSVQSVTLPFDEIAIFPATSMIVCFQITGCMLLILAYYFLRNTQIISSENILKTVYTFTAVSVLSILCSFFLPWAQITVINNFPVMTLNKFGTTIVTFQCINLIFALFIIENTYRFAHEYQRKIARFCFIAFLSLIGFMIYYSGRLILFKTFSANSIEAGAVIFSISYPVLLIGLLRYRLGSEHVSIPRNTVYSSFSLLLIGSLFFSAGITAYVFNFFKIDLIFFDKTIISFSFLLFIILIGGSGEMRKRIVLFVNKQFYTHKYDYREQFFRLHQLFVGSGNIETTINELIDNMKFAVTVDDAFLFLQNPQNGNFLMHHNKDSRTKSNIILHDNNPIIPYLSSNRSPLDIFSTDCEEAAKLITENNMFTELKIDCVFPVFSNDSLLGILALRRKNNSRFDSEDHALIQAFTTSIGETIFKNRILDERIRRKQFESFTQVSSFIVHDIKNQISTLSLLVKNIERNINNPDFQKSMIQSLQNCTQNLQLLIDKLQSPVKASLSIPVDCRISEIIDGLIDNMPVESMPGIIIDRKIDQSLVTHVDEKQIYYVFKNLFNNALEAMNYSGTLSVKTIKLPCIPELLSGFKDVGESFINQFGIAILISDTGIGMSKEFIDEKLFRPFNTTKDKGIGIGLYQCKTLVENMNGKILVSSKNNAGTVFCILLK